MSKPITKATVRLTEAIDSSSTTIKFTATDSTRSLTSVTMSDFGTYGYLTINPKGKTDNYEIVRFESWSASGSTITIGTLTRNLELEGDDTSGTGRSFPAGTTAIISDNHHWFNNVVLTEGNQTIAGQKTFSGVTTLADSSQLATSAAPTADEDIANKKYVDDTAVSGAPNASTTVKGIVEIGTDAENAAGTGTGGTGAVNVVTSSSCNETAAAGKIPVAESGGAIGVDWIGISNQGEIPYNDGGTIPAGLTIGSAGQVLMVDSGGTDPEWGTLEGLPSSPSADDMVIYDGSNWVNATIGEAACRSTFSYYDIIENPSFTSTDNINSYTDTVAFGGQISATYDSSLSYAARGVDVNDLYNATNHFKANFRCKITITTDASSRLATWGIVGTGVGILHSAASTWAGNTTGAVFQYENGTLSSVTRTANGSTTTNTVTGVTVTDFNDYEIYHDGTDIKFYVNGELKQTHTTNLPSSTAESLGYGVRDASSDATTGITLTTNKITLGYNGS